MNDKYMAGVCDGRYMTSGLRLAICSKHSGCGLPGCPYRRLNN